MDESSVTTRPASRAFGIAANVTSRLVGLAGKTEISRPSACATFRRLSTTLTIWGLSKFHNTATRSSLEVYARQSLPQANHQSDPLPSRRNSRSLIGAGTLPPPPKWGNLGKMGGINPALCRFIRANQTDLEKAIDHVVSGRQPAHCCDREPADPAATSFRRCVRPLVPASGSTAPGSDSHRCTA